MKTIIARFQIPQLRAAPDVRLRGDEGDPVEGLGHGVAPGVQGRPHHNRLDHGHAHHERGNPQGEEVVGGEMMRGGGGDFVCDVEAERDGEKEEEKKGDEGLSSLTLSLSLYSLLTSAAKSLSAAKLSSTHCQCRVIGMKIFYCRHMEDPERERRERERERERNREGDWEVRQIFRDCTPPSLSFQLQTS